MAHKEGHLSKEGLNFSAGVASFDAADARMKKERDAVQSGDSTKERGKIAKEFIKGRNKDRPMGK